MIKRKITFDNYDTAANGWTLAGWQLSDAQAKTYYEDKPGGDGSWDLSTALTDGLVRYNDRTLTVRLECSEGDRLSREAKIRHMVNLLDGMRVNIELPDDPYHYINGRLHIVRDYNDMAHAAVTVTATCKPWKYSTTETVVTLSATSQAKTAKITNSGRLAVVPLLTGAGSSKPSINLTFGASTFTIAGGTYQWPELLLTPGSHELTYQGVGSLAITYREAVLE